MLLVQQMQDTLAGPVVVVGGPPSTVLWMSRVVGQMRMLEMGWAKIDWDQSVPGSSIQACKKPEEMGKKI